jgi:hypothetical protein
MLCISWKRLGATRESKEGIEWRVPSTEEVLKEAFCIVFWIFTDELLIGIIVIKVFLKCMYLPVYIRTRDDSSLKHNSKCK